jgi:hypothetical protein
VTTKARNVKIYYPSLTDGKRVTVFMDEIWYSIKKLNNRLCEYHFPNVRWITVMIRSTVCTMKTDKEAFVRKQ